MNEVAIIPGMEELAKVMITGNLATLSDSERIIYYKNVCDTVGLNPYTKPFEYITLNGKLSLYALKGATDQLRRLYGISIDIVSAEVKNDIYTVWVKGVDATGRFDSDSGCVNIKGLSGEALANASMKAVSKAKRRLTLSICGLGMLDESEVDDIPGAKKMPPESIQQKKKVAQRPIPFETAKTRLLNAKTMVDLQKEFKEIITAVVNVDEKNELINIKDEQKKLITDPEFIPLGATA